jgi:hypothetical protein
MWDRTAEQSPADPARRRNPGSQILRSHALGRGTVFFVMTADGAYDGEAVYDAAAERHPSATVIIPPRVTSVADGTKATQRHLAMIDEHGRMAWQRRSGYDRRSLVETAMFRYKTIIGRKLQARTLSNQKTEAKIGCNVLNRMAGLGMPASARVR